MNRQRLKINIFISVLWVLGTFGFISEEFSLEQYRSFVFLYCDIIFIMLTINSTKLKKQIKDKTVLLFIIFLLIGLVSFIKNIDQLSFIDYLNGLRDFIPIFFTLIFIKEIMSSDYSFLLIRKIDKFIIWFLLLQIPCSIFQLLKYGAGDQVGGSMGLGYSGILSITIFVSTFYLMMKDAKLNSFGNVFIKKSYLLLFWIPSFINETKITVLLILIFFLFLLTFRLSSLVKNIIIAALLYGAIILYSGYYEKTTNLNLWNTVTSDYYVNEYSTFGDPTRYSDIPRSQKLILAYELFSNDIIDLLFGKSFGHFKGGTTLNESVFTKNYSWLLRGSISYVFLTFIQTGLLGVFIIALLYYQQIKLLPKKTKSNYFRIFWHTMVVLCFCTFYNPILRVPLITALINYILFYSIYSSNKIKIGKIDEVDICK